MKRPIALLFCLLMITVPLAGCFGGDDDDSADAPIQELNDWNVSNVVDMNSMFSKTSFNKNLNNWNVSNVKDMGSMFSGAKLFIGIGLSKWDTSNVRDMSYMFCNAYDFNENISNWNTSNV